MDHITAKVGYDVAWQVTIVDSTGAAITTYTGSEPLSATVWAGDDQAPLFSPTVSWVSAAAGTTNIAIASAQTLGMTPGKYRVLASLTDSTGAKRCFYEAVLDLTYAPGSATPRPTYIAFADLRPHAAWIEDLQDELEDQTGFAEQRALARDWLDGMIIRNYHGGGASQVGPNGYWMNTWAMRGTLLTSQFLLELLNGGGLILSNPSGAQVKRACANYALGKICRGQLGRGTERNYAALARWFETSARSEVTSLIVEIDTNGDGIGEIPITLTNTMTRYT